MGTRADFYVGRGTEAEWLGSIGWDGYEIDDSIHAAKTEEEYRAAVTAFLDGRMVRDPEALSVEDALKEARAKAIESGMDDHMLEHFAKLDPYAPTGDATYPKDGWPWPWEDSNTTDYAYAFDAGYSWINVFGHGWHTKEQGEAWDKVYNEWEEASEVEDDEPCPAWETGGESSFPNMKDVQNVQIGGKKGGMMVLSVKDGDFHVD